MVLFLLHDYNARLARQARNEVIGAGEMNVCNECVSDEIEGDGYPAHGFVWEA